MRKKSYLDWDGNIIAGYNDLHGTLYRIAAADDSTLLGWNGKESVIISASDSQTAFHCYIYVAGTELLPEGRRERNSESRSLAKARRYLRIDDTISWVSWSMFT